MSNIFTFTELFHSVESRIKNYICSWDLLSIIDSCYKLVYHYGRTLALAVKENERILSRGKENKLIKEQKFIEKRVGEINYLERAGNNAVKQRG